MPFFLNPFAFAGLAAIPILVGIYYLRNRFKRQVVSSLLLWDGIIKSNEGGQKKDRLQLPWMFFLELLGLLALAFAATQPFFKTTSQRIPITVILDDSFSMLANSPEESGELRTVKARVEERLKKLMEMNLYEVELIVSGRDSRRLGEDVISNWPDLEKSLIDWHCKQSSVDLVRAIEMVKKMHGIDHRILIFSDHAPAQVAFEDDPSLQWVSLGQAVKNIAITFASRKSVLTESGSWEKLLIRVESFSGKDDDVVNSSELKISDAQSGEVVATQVFQLDANSKKEIALDLPETVSRSDFLISIPEDSVESDNQLYLLAEELKTISVHISLNDEAYRKLWIDALRVIPRVEINVTPIAKCDLVISDGSFVLQPEQWHIYCPPQNKPVAFAGPYAVAAEHPLANGLPIQGAIWAANPDLANKRRKTDAAAENGTGEKGAKKTDSDPSSDSSKAPVPGKTKPTEPKDENSEPKKTESKNNSQTESTDVESSDVEPSDKSAGGYSVIRTGQSDLVSDQTLSKLRRRITIRLNPQYSTVSISPPTWIVMVVNLLEWRKKFFHGPEYKNTWQSQQTIRFPLNTRKATLVSTLGERKTIPVINGTAEVETFENGIWAIEMEPVDEELENPTGELFSEPSGENQKAVEGNASQNGDVKNGTLGDSNEPKVWRWSYYGLSSNESNLKDAQTETLNNWQELNVAKRDVYQPFAWLLGLLALIFISASCLFQRPMRN